MNKFTVTTLNDVGKKGPGVYVVILGPKRRKVITVTDTTKMVEQSQSEYTRIDKLLEPAIKAGLLRHTIKYEGEMDDIPVSDYNEAMNVVARAKSMFEELPSRLRAKFKTTEQFLEFVQNPANAQEMREMGMLRGNDGITRYGTPSGAPTRYDHNGDGITDRTPNGEPAPGQPPSTAEPPPAQTPPQ